MVMNDGIWLDKMKLLRQKRANYVSQNYKIPFWKITILSYKMTVMSDKNDGSVRQNDRTEGSDSQIEKLAVGTGYFD